jgi:hypothetical protein
MDTTDLNAATYHFVRAAYFHAIGNPIWQIEQAKALKSIGYNANGPVIVRKVPKNARPNPWRRNANKKLMDEGHALTMDVANPAMSPMMGKFAAMSKQG